MLNNFHCLVRICGEALDPDILGPKNSILSMGCQELRIVIELSNQGFVGRFSLGFDLHLLRRRRKGSNLALHYLLELRAEGLGEIYCKFNVVCFVLFLNLKKGIGGGPRIASLGGELCL
jgi:hypothetical protein